MLRSDRHLPAAIARLARAWQPLAVFLAVAVAAGCSALYVRAVTKDDAARLLHARAGEFASIVEANTHAMQAAITIARIADAAHRSDWMARDAAPVISGVPGIGMWIAEPTADGGRSVAAAGDPSALRATMTRAEWRAVFAVRGTTVRPTLVRRRPDGSLLLGVVTDLTGGRAIVLELDVRRLIATTIGPRSGVQGALYFGSDAFPSFLIAATRADGVVPAPRASRVLDLGGVPSLLVIGDPTSVGPGWLPPAIFVGGLLVALIAASLVEALRRRRDAALATVALLEDRNEELDELGVKLRSAAAELAHRADHDELTGLANRALLHRRVHEAAAAGAVGIVLFDLDDFKAINDTLGHDAGDAALRIVAERLLVVAGERALAVRLGGDEFALCTASADPAELRALSELVLDSVGGTAGIAGRSLELGLSIGTAAWPGTTELPGDLLRDADLAMYAAKRGRRAESARPIVHHEAALRTAVEARIAALAELRTALAADELVVHYQPLVDLGSGETVAVEALARWQHPVRGLLGPAAFVPVAEEGGLIGAVGRFVVETACRDLAALRRSHPRLTMSVNVSALELAEAGFAERILDAVAAHGLEPAALELEITERVLVDARTALSTLELLRDRGVRVAIDDFGTGYSSPLYLRQLPTAALKVDRAFVADSGGAAGRGILAALLDLAHHAGLEAVAEGVETPEQLALLRELGCARGQGYLFSRPLPLARLYGYLGDALAA